MRWLGKWLTGILRWLGMMKFDWCKMELVLKANEQPILE